MSRNRSWFNRLDFVNVGDNTIAKLFVNQAVREKHSVLLFPPKAMRRRATQVRDFYRYGVGQQSQLIEKYSRIQIATPPVEIYISPQPGKCLGIRKADILSLRTTREKILSLISGYEDLVSEAIQTRDRLLETDQKKWAKMLRHPVD